MAKTFSIDPLLNLLNNMKTFAVHEHDFAIQMIQEA